MDLRELSKNRMHIITCAAFLCSLCSAATASAEVSLRGTVTKDYQQTGEPTFSPVTTCLRIEDEKIMNKGALLLTQKVDTTLNTSLSDFSDFPDLVSVDDCGDFYIFTSVLGNFTSGHRLRMIVPKQEFKSYMNGISFQSDRIRKTDVILFRPTVD